MAEDSKTLGATGEHPEGKLTPEDEGEVRMAVGSEQGKVVIAFGTPVAWLGVSPTRARELAMSLLKHADSVDGAVTISVGRDKANVFLGRQVGERVLPLIAVPAESALAMGRQIIRHADAIARLAAQPKPTPDGHVTSVPTAEQRARDMLEALGVSDAQGYSAGDLVGIGNMIAMGTSIEAKAYAHGWADAWSLHTSEN